MILRNSKDFLTNQTGIRNVHDIEISKVIKKKQIEKSISSFLERVITTTELKREKIHGYQIIVNLLPFQNASQFRTDFATQESAHEDLIKPYLSKKYITFLKNLKNKKFFNNANLAEYFLHKEVKLLDSDGTPASGGQAVGFALMLRLNEARQKNVILIDEPESSLDNAYIQTELNSALKELAKHRMVFVVTHNSTLGTLLEPDYLVVTAKNEQNEYTVLTGEFSSNKISDSKLNSESSFEKFVEAMEAGIKTYQKKEKFMEILINDGNRCFFNIGEQRISPQDLSKDDLVKIFNSIYESENEIKVPDDSMIASIKNPIEKEIVDQIVRKIKEFSDNIENIRQEINSQFPKIEDTK
ncbi:hypothetical protein ACXOMP_07835 [Streptococcus thermophilus]